MTADQRVLTRGVSADNPVRVKVRNCVLPEGESVTISERVPLREVVVIRGLVSDAAAELIAEGTGCLVIVLGEGQTLESLDEAEMAEHGWRKC